MENKILHGDCLDVLRTLPADSVDAVVTDPPYGLAFMGKKWDYQVPGVETWREVLRVLKPGGHALVACGTRTQHRMAVNVEDAGFEIRDLIAWIYGSGFPKSLNANAAMDKWLAGEQPASPVYKVTAFLREARDRAGWTNGKIDAMFGTNGMAGHWTSSKSQPAVPSPRQWEMLKQALGFGDEMDALVADLGATERPEDWGIGEGGDERFLDTLGDKRTGEPHRWGTALKPTMELWTLARKPLAGTVSANVQAYGTGALNIAGCRGDAGRWPANMIHDGSDEVVDLLPAGAARFFYCAKASREERNLGLKNPGPRRKQNDTTNGKYAEAPNPHDSNFHPTVKPLALMRYLCRLITPPAGLVLDPFAGSGTTAMAAKAEGFRYLAIEREPEYVAIAEARVASVVVNRTLPLEASA